MFFYEETDVITFGLYEDENSILPIVNDMNSDLAYLYNVHPNGSVHFNIDCMCMLDINSIQLDSFNMGTNDNPKNIYHDVTPEEKENFERILIKRKVVFT